ncbi:MAG: hypothetical protein H7Z41_04150, partial [Cytophagales bacterium]|nr:hypothetical protein [Armatimonadota bacterium]
CESRLAHQGGANYIFLDGHAKWLKGNIEIDYPARASNGQWIERYLTYDRDL